MSDKALFDRLTGFVRDWYGTSDFVPLHAPVFEGHEKSCLEETIDSTFVSSVGAYVDRFERDMERYTGAGRAVATVNGTAALHTALILAGVRPGDLVLTQSLTFVATCNAISYCQARPVFIDVDPGRLSLSPQALESWLEAHARIHEGSPQTPPFCEHKESGQPVRACVPMHTFGHPADMERLMEICRRWHIFLIEDAAESLGSLYQDRHTGTFGQSGILSFNGNKIMTTGGGGMILTDEQAGSRAKHLTTTAKRAHPYEFHHDEIGYNYRMPNLNAALGCAQLEQLDHFVRQKRELAFAYRDFFKDTSLQWVCEPADSRSNFWLNAVICEDRQQRDALLQATNEAGIMTRPVWQLMHTLPLFADALRDGQEQARWLADRLVNLPSSVRPRNRDKDPSGTGTEAGAGQKLEKGKHA